MDEDKTKEQLIDELAELRRRIADLEASETECRRAEEALLTSEKRYRELFENANDGVYTHDLAGNFTSFNRLAEQVSGYTRDEALKMNIAEIVAPEYLGLARRMIARKVTKGVSTTYELEIVAKDGRRVPVEVSTRIIYEGENPVEVQGVARDITERKLVEEELRKHRDHLEELVAERTAELMRANEQLRREVAERKRVEEALRRRAEELAALQATVLDVIASLDLPTLLQTIVERATRLLNAPGGGLYLCDPEQGEVRCVVSHNTPRDYRGTVLKYGEGAAGTVAQTGEPLIIDDYRDWSRRAAVYEEGQPFSAVLVVPMIWQGQVIGTINVLEDAESRQFTQADLELLTLFANHAAIAVENTRSYEQAQKEIAERKRTEEALRESEHKFRSIVEQSHDGICLIDEQGAIIEWNRGLEQITGLKRAEVMGWPIGGVLVQMIPDEEKSQERYERIETSTDQFFRTGQAPWLNRLYEASIQRVDGALRVVQQLTFPIETEKGSMTGSIIRDITERRRVEDEVKILRGLLPICASCKKIRDDRGYWNQLEVYIREHSEADFTHSICPDCGKKLYGSYWGKGE
jgi:PAS domain S-box-containing protein